MSTPYPSILLFGPPGSGKGTIGRKLAVVTEQYHLSSGDVFRGLSKESEMGQMQKSYSDQGLLVPDEITIKICLNYIKGLIYTNRFYPEKQHLVLDGFPRTLPQAKLLATHLDVKQIILLEVPDEEMLIKRLQKRATLEGRLDDMDLSILRKRMDVYKNQTEEVLSFYPKEIITTINGAQSPNEVFRDVMIKIAAKF
ncbi:nucleoside monophosphate kinase [Chlamydiales bacterium]|nr:nucleoside monophosphate kinase [Chlamydiales bacterium]